MFQVEISSFALRLAAAGKAAKTIRTYTEAVQWFAAARLTDHDSRIAWEQVSSQDIQRWMAHLLDRYSTAYASNQYRALQQFFKWLTRRQAHPASYGALSSGEHPGRPRDAPDPPTARRHLPSRRPQSGPPEISRVWQPSQPWPPTASHAGRATNQPPEAGAEVPEQPTREPTKAVGVPHRNPTSHLVRGDGRGA